MKTARVEIPLEWVNAPRQARSQRTLERLLDAAEAIIRESGVDALTIPEVVRRAGSSTGSFYARFPDKMALLSTLHERACEQTLATAALALAPARWQGTSTEHVVRSIVSFAVGVFGSRRSLMQAFAVAFAGDPSFTTRRARTAIDLARLVEDLLLSRIADLGHPNPREAVRMALRVVTATLEQRNGFAAARLGSFDVSDDTLEAELSRLVLAYLGIR